MDPPRPSDASALVDRLLAQAARASRGALTAAAAADLADAALGCGRESDALSPVEAAARHHRHAALWQWAGLLHRALEQHAAAINAYRTAIRLDPANARAAHGLARVMLEAGLPASAAFERAAKLAPSDGDVLRGRAAARLAEGEGARAIAELEALLGENPGWLPGHESAASIACIVGRRSRFTELLERSIRVAPRDARLWNTLIVLLLRAEQYEAALDAVRRARAVLGSDRMLDTHEAAIAAELGDGATAERLFAQLDAGKDPVLAIYRLRHLLRTRHADEAAALAETLVEEPGGAGAWPYLALAWRLIGDRRAAWLEGEPGLVGVYDIADRLPALPALAERLRAIHVSTDRNLGQSVRGGTQTDGPLFSRIDPEIRQVRAAVVEAVDTYLADLPPRDSRHPLLRHRRDRPVRFSGSWSVRLRNAGHHANHIHPEGWLSSALYVAVPEAAARGPEPAGWLALGEPPVELGLALPAVRLIEPLPGRLVLFPSYIWHGTRPFAAGERLTIAFDVAPPAPD